MCKELDTRFRARAAERTGTPRYQKCNRSAPGTTGSTGGTASTPAPANPMGTNSGHYGAAVTPSALVTPQDMQLV